MKTVIGVVFLATILLRLFHNMFSLLPVNGHNTYQGSAKVNFLVKNVNLKGKATLKEVMEAHRVVSG
jgi:hypothetical protein